MMRTHTKTMRWAIEWHSKNRLDGEAKHIVWRQGLPVLFCTRSEARAWRDENYGYIRERDDLKTEPHGWRLPRVKRVRVILEPVSP